MIAACDEDISRFCRADAKPGSYTLAVTGDDGLVKHKLDISLVLQPNPNIAAGIIATPGPGPQNDALSVRIFNANRQLIKEFTAFNTEYGATSVSGDIDGDGYDEVIISEGPGPKNTATLWAYRRDGTLMAELTTFNTTYGLSLATADLDDDWKDELIVGTGPDPKNIGTLKILKFNGSGFTEVMALTLYAQATYGITIAAGDVRSTWVLLVALLLGLPATPAQDAVGAPPKDLGLVERSGARLAQIDITVLGPPELIANLTPEDFPIRVQFKPIREFVLDRYCDAPPAPAGPVDDAGKPGPIRVAAARAPSSYLFFMDQIHLTLSGRQNAISLARQLVRELIHDGNRGMLVSNANELLVAQVLTDDPRALLDALERLENDRTHWHEFASQEDARVNDVVETMRSADEMTTIENYGSCRLLACCGQTCTCLFHCHSSWGPQPGSAVVEIGAD